MLNVRIAAWVLGGTNPSLRTSAHSCWRTCAEKEEETTPRSRLKTHSCRGSNGTQISEIYELVVLQKQNFTKVKEEIEVKDRL